MILIISTVEGKNFIFKNNTEYRVSDFVTKYMSDFLKNFGKE